MISVLMPVYNCEKYISQAITSILNQTFKEFEFLIINDGSTDNTEKVINTFSDKRIKYIKRKHSGISNTLNYGIEKAQYDLIARMDADDIAHPERLKIQIDYMLKNPGIDVISSWYAVFNKNKIAYIIKLPEWNDEIVKKLALFSSVCHPSVIFKKEKIKILGGYNENLNGAQDYDLWLRAKNDLIFYNIQEVLTLYRYDSNFSDKYKRNIFYHIQEKYYKNIEKEFNITDRNEKLYNRAVRELFYGDKHKARELMLKSNFVQIFSIRSLYVIFISFLKEKRYEKILHKKFWLRISFLKLLLKMENRKKLKELNIILKLYS
ncbi:MAG: glycosyl transferase family 2 [Ignavibacteriae bacterium]|nr:MAG: glycosyl transferase family 2 [Ignavibacteriota bacterium]